MPLRTAAILKFSINLLYSHKNEQKMYGVLRMMLERNEDANLIINNTTYTHTQARREAHINMHQQLRKHLVAWSTWSVLIEKFTNGFTYVYPSGIWSERRKGVEFYMFANTVVS